MKINFKICLYIYTEDEGDNIGEGYYESCVNKNIEKDLVFWLKNGVRPNIKDRLIDGDNHYCIDNIFLTKGIMHLDLKTL